MNVPDSIKKLHSILWDAGLSTVLAGGACRDLVCNRVPKDYDLTVLGTGWLYIDGLVNLTATIPGTGPLVLKQATGYSDNHRVGEVWEFTYEGLLVNVIFPNLSGDGAWHTPQDVLDHFDTSLNLVWFDFDNDEFVIDDRAAAKTGKVTFISDPDKVGYGRTDRRYHRLEPRYPALDWSEVKQYLGIAQYTPFTLEP